MEALLALGAWNWMILAAVLFVLELVAPGIFFMWFGLAAAVTGLIMFRYDISWQWQLIWFCGLSLASVLIVYRYLRKHPLESEQPLLNRRADQLIGHSFDLVDPIVNGRGSIHSGDTIWRVEGPELPVGTAVKVVGADGSVLKVEPAEGAAA
ncbi:MAG TPA: NfeD family protein [Methyloceanibacter sp.]|nr:NfeD family protein [Methyloceanibacter sp.]